MNLAFESMVDYGLERSAKVLARGFEDYFVAIPFSVPMLLNLTRGDSVDLAVSRVVVRDNIPVAAALIARRGWTCRLAAMAILPEARRSGIGCATVVQLLDEARARRDRTMVLEVIEQNIPAVELYRVCGFDTIRRLIGFGGSTAPPVDEIDQSSLTEVDLRDVAQMVCQSALPDLPWQLSGETIAQLSPPAVGYRLGNAWIAITDPSQPIVAVRALVGRPGSGGFIEPNSLAALVRAVVARHPGKTEWRFHPIWPEELCDQIAPLGLPRTPLSQWQMKREI
jgi:GNAT superfamily N-acetyltransferase